MAEFVLYICNTNTAEEWFEAKHRATVLRRYRTDLAPGLADELADLERAGY